MKIFFDTEFIEDGRTIDLMSIGMIKENGQTLYLENSECDLSRADNWVKENVIPNLLFLNKNPEYGFSKKQIAYLIQEFIGDERPEFWSYFCSYDWVAFCQLYGKMIDLPGLWPMYCNDLKQLIDSKGLSVSQDDSNHNALNDAEWIMEMAQSLGVF